MYNPQLALEALVCLTSNFDNSLPLEQRQAIFRQICWRTSRLRNDKKLDSSARERALGIQTSSEFFLGLTDEIRSEGNAACLLSTLRSELWELKEILTSVELHARRGTSRDKMAITAHLRAQNGNSVATD